MPPAVAELIDAFEKDVKVSPDNKWVVPDSVLARGMNFRWPAYRFSKEVFPLAVPQVDDDASRLGLRSPTSLPISSKMFEKWEAKCR